MSWLAFAIQTSPEAVDWVTSLLADAGAIENFQIASTIPATLANPAWIFTLSWRIPDDHRARSRLRELDDLLAPLQRTGMAGVLEFDIQEDRAAEAAAGMPIVRRIGQRWILLSPTSTDVPVAGELPLRMPNSFAFGSGLHPATILCLRLLERYVSPGMHALDLGCGTGILSLAIARLGATHVLALDNDPIAVAATQEAIRCNQMESHITGQRGSLGVGSDLGHWMSGTIPAAVPRFDAVPTFDLIVSNILARVHVALALDYYQALRQSGIVITAGFTRDRAGEMTDALQAAGLELMDAEESGEWNALAYRRPKVF